MLNIALFNQNGEKLNDLELNENVFGIEPNNQAIFDVVLLQRASLRQGTHKVKNRHEVSGGGKKPWRQKGTGRARQGSIHSGAVEELSLVLLQEAMTSRLTRKLRILH